MGGGFAGGPAVRRLRSRGAPGGLAVGAMGVEGLEVFLKPARPGVVALLLSELESLAGALLGLGELPEFGVGAGQDVQGSGVVEISRLTGAPADGQGLVSVAHLVVRAGGQ